MVSEAQALVEMLRHAFPGAEAVDPPTRPVVPAVHLWEFAQAMAEVEERGGTITLELGKVVVKVPGGVPAPLRYVLGAHLDLLRAVAIGRTGSPHARLETGSTRHALGICSVCGEPSMVAVTRGRLHGGGWPACRMTPRCQGRHAPVDRDLEVVT